MPDAQGNIKGIALGGKAAETWERIFGGEPAGPLTEGAFMEAMEAVVRGGWDAVRERENRQHYGDPAPEGAGLDELRCDCGPDDCPCCCRCGC